MKTYLSLIKTELNLRESLVNGEPGYAVELRIKRPLGTSSFTLAEFDDMQNAKQFMHSFKISAA